MFALIAAPAHRAGCSGPMPSRQAAQGRGMRRCESVKNQRDEQKKVDCQEEITNGEIMLSPEPAEERRVRSRHGSPRGVCAAAAWA